jgi:hypothetical protein
MPTFTKPPTPNELQTNILNTYFTLRMGIVVMSAGLPLLLIGYSWATHGRLEELTMSAFYGAYGGAMRNWFVGILWAVGSFLILYSGFSALEEWLLNFAGGFAILTAMTPCNCWSNSPLPKSTVHEVFAVTFFACMVMVCEFCAQDTVSLLPDEATRTRYRRTYHTIGFLLAASPIAAIAASYLLQAYISRVFFIEWFGVTIFALYWAVKSREFHITSAEKRAILGQLKHVPGLGFRPADEPDAVSQAIAKPFRSRG